MRKFRTSRLLITAILVSIIFITLILEHSPVSQIVPKINNNRSIYVIRTVPISSNLSEVLEKDFQFKKVNGSTENHQFELIGFENFKDAAFQLYKITNDLTETRNILYIYNTEISDKNGILTYSNTEGEYELNNYTNHDGVIIFSSYFSLTGTTDSYAVIESYGKCFFLNNEGLIPFPIAFNEAEPFSDGLAAVKVGEEWGFINESGMFVIKPQFDFARSFCEGLAPISISGQWGYIDKNGDLKIDTNFMDADVFSEGLAAVMVENKGYGYIDINGNIKIEPLYAACQPFNDGKAHVFGILHEYVIDSLGQRVDQISGNYSRLKLENNYTASIEIENFIKELSKKINDKDTEYIKQLMRNTRFNDELIQTKEDFLNAWGLISDPQNSPFWNEFESLIEMGVSANSKFAFSAPYLYDQFPQSYNPICFNYIETEKAPIYIKPDVNSQIIDQYGYELIARLNTFVYIDSKNVSWVAVVLCNGEIGYMLEQDLWAPTDLVVRFIFIENHWEIELIGKGEI